MKQIISEYGGAVIAVLGALSFFVICNSVFVSEDSVIRKLLMYSLTENSVIEHNAFDAYMNEEAPVISEKGEYVVAAGENVIISDYYEAKSNRNEILPIYLRSTWDFNGQKSPFEISADGKSFRPVAPGVYWMEIYCMDHNGKETSRIVKLLVNER